MRSEPTVEVMPGPWGKAIERLRLERGITREVAARRAKMTPTTYGRIERGQHTQTRKLQDIADVFDVPIDAVLYNSLLTGRVLKEHNTNSTIGLPKSESWNARGDLSAASEIASLRSQLQHLHFQVEALQAAISERDAIKEHSARSVESTRHKTSSRKPLRHGNVRKTR